MISRLFKKILFLFRRALSNDQQWIDYLRSCGVEIGDGCRIIDRTVPAEPWLVTIGNHVTITDGCKLLTHDGAIWLARQEHPGINRFAPILIGDNCFVGTNSILLAGTVIGNDSIVAAGSVVRGEIAAGSVVGGVPAKLICSSAGYLEKALGESMPLDDLRLARIRNGEDPTQVMKSLLIEKYRSRSSQRANRESKSE